MDVFPGAYVAKLSITAALMIGAVIITALSSRVQNTLRDADGLTTKTLPFTTWIGALTLFFEAMLVIVRQRQEDDPESVAASAALDIAWSAAAWLVWLADVICVTRMTWNCEWSSSACANIGVLCAFTWVEWCLLTSRLLVIAAENAKIRLSDMIQALHGKIAPWFKAAKEPVVQIAASLGVLLSGVLGSVGLLLTGVFGVVDRLFDVVGLGGMRRRLMRALGWDRMIDTLGVDKVLAGLGLPALLGDSPPPPPRDGKKTDGGSDKIGLPIVGDLGLGGGGGRSSETAGDGESSGGGGLPIVGDLGLGGGRPSETAGGGESSGGGGLPIVGDLGLGKSTATTTAPAADGDVKLRKRGGGGGGAGGGGGGGGGGLITGVPVVGRVVEGAGSLPVVGGVLQGAGSGLGLGSGAPSSSAAPADKVEVKNRNGGVGSLPLVGGLLGG